MGNYGLPQPIVRYLSNVTQSGDYREYENHKKNLFKLCSSSEEYERANKCLVEMMTI